MAEKKKSGAASQALRQSDYRELAEFRRFLRTFLAFSEGAARAAGLTPQQHQALLAIKGFEGEGPVTVGDLSKHLSIRHHSAVGLVDRLVQARLLDREHSSNDRRRVTLALTDEARKLLAKLTVAHRNELRRTTPTLRAIVASFED
jgi:DNA-binding MarR family transcriptional regulator